MKATCARWWSGCRARISGTAARARSISIFDASAVAERHVSAVRREASARTEPRRVALRDGECEETRAGPQEASGGDTEANELFFHCLHSAAPEFAICLARA